MLRRLFTILSALSLLLCVATVVLWVRSYWIADYYSALEYSNAAGAVLVRDRGIWCSSGGVNLAIGQITGEYG